MDYMVLAVQAEKMQSSDLKTIVGCRNLLEQRGKVIQKTTNCFDVLYPCDSVAKYGYTVLKETFSLLTVYYYCVKD